MMVVALRVVFLMLVVTPLDATPRTARTGVISRLNYGVVFRQQHPLRIITGEWTHVFVSQLPDPPVVNNLVDLRRFNCSDVHNTSAATCMSFEPLLNTLLSLHQISVSRVRSVVSQLYASLPESYHNRPVRGLFDLGGQILHSLFGVATDQQIDAIRDTARQTLSSNADALRQWQKHANAMSSFMSVANERLDNIAGVLRDHDQLVHNVLRSVSRLDNDISILRTLVESAVYNITNFISVLNELDDIRIAVEDLVHGQLSPVLVPPRVLERALLDLHDDLFRSGLSLTASIIHGDVVADFYRLHNFVAARQGTKLLIAVKFPLSSAPSPYTLYEIQSFPVPVPGLGNTAHVTQIVNLPYGVAFLSTVSHSEYIIFPTKPDLTDRFFFFGYHQSHLMRRFSVHNTCVSALLQNDRQRITELCQFHLRPESLLPSLIPLTPTTVFVTNVSSIVSICKRKRSVDSGCLHCQVTVPCHCSIDTSVGFIPPRLTDCISSGDNVTMYHTVNLAVLQSFFADEHLGSLLGDTLLHRPLPVDLPEFRIFLPNDTSRLAKD